MTCLPTVTGAWQYEGGGALQSNHGLVALDHTLLEGLDVLDPATRILDSRAWPGADRRPPRPRRRPAGDRIFIQNTNPVVVAPKSGLVRGASPATICSPASTSSS